jgi:hypothetical protein
MQAGQVGRELVVARCHAPAVLDFIEEPFDQISGPVKIRAEAQCPCPISLRWDIRPGAVLVNKVSDPACIISTVSQQH